MGGVTPTEMREGQPRKSRYLSATERAKKRQPQIRELRVKKVNFRLENASIGRKMKKNYKVYSRGFNGQKKGRNDRFRRGWNAGRGTKAPSSMRPMAGKEKTLGSRYPKRRRRRSQDGKKHQADG